MPEEVMSLLVPSIGNFSVLEYDETTGAFIRAAVSGVNCPSVVIGLDGNLLVADSANNQVKRYDRRTGAFIGVFASTNLVGPAAMTIHGGALYVVNNYPPHQTVLASTPPRARTPATSYPRSLSTPTREM